MQPLGYSEANQIIFTGRNYAATGGSDIARGDPVKIIFATAAVPNIGSEDGTLISPTFMIEKADADDDNIVGIATVAMKKGATTANGEGEFGGFLVYGIWNATPVEASTAAGVAVGFDAGNGWLDVGATNKFAATIQAVPASPASSKTPIVVNTLRWLFGL